MIHMESNKLAGLVGPLSHDFNNLACAVKLFSQMALKKLSADHPARVYLTHLVEVSELMPEVTDKILSLVGPEDLVFEAWNINDVICDLEDIFNFIVGHGVKILLNLGSDAGSVSCEIHTLQQIILIFAAYGRDSNDNFGRLTISTSRGSTENLVAAGEVSNHSGACTLITMDYGCFADGESAERGSTSNQAPLPDKHASASYWLSTAQDLIGELGGHLKVHDEHDTVTGVEIYLPQCNERQVLETPQGSLRER